MVAKSIDLELEVQYANTYWTRLKGLLFHKKPLQIGLLITPCNSIHMFFMRFSIDVVFLDHDNKVVKLVSHLKPWRIVPPVPNAVSTLELPIGTIDSYTICVGDQLHFRK